MRPSFLSYSFLTGFLTTLFWLQWWQRTDYPLSLWIFLCFLCAICALCLFPSQTRMLSACVLSSLLGMILAFSAVSRTTHVPAPSTVDSWTGKEEVAIRGTVAEDADRRVSVTNYTLEAEVLKSPTTLRKVTGRILVTVRAGAIPFEYGDPVVVRGKLEKPKVTKEFRYDNYLSRVQVYSVMKDAMVERAGPNAGNPVLLRLFRLRAAIEERINQLLPEPQASLLGGLLLGAKRGMPEAVLADFKTTGLTHVVAISGYNITMLVTVIGALLFWLPLRWRFVPSVVLIGAFTLLTGASASAVRAAVMGILSLLAMQTGRMSTTRLSVLWSAFFMLAWNPKLLWYDAGFHLSFLALLGVMEISPLIKPLFRWLPERFGIRDSLCLTVSAQVLASAWIAYLFGELSLIAPLANLLVPPAVPYAMLLGTIALVASTVWMPLGRIAATIGWIPLAWITGAAQAMAMIPFAAVALAKLSTVWIAAYYGFFAGWVTMYSAQSSGSSPAHPLQPSPPPDGGETGTHAPPRPLPA